MQALAATALRAKSESEGRKLAEELKSMGSGPSSTPLCFYSECSALTMEGVKSVVEKAVKFHIECRKRGPPARPCILT